MSLKTLGVKTHLQNNKGENWNIENVSELNFALDESINPCKLCYASSPTSAKTGVICQKNQKKPLWCLCFPRFCRDRERVFFFFFLLKRDCLNCCWCNPVGLERKCTKTWSSSSVKWGKNPPTNDTKPSTRVAFFSSCLSGKLCGPKPPVHPSASTATPPVAFPSRSAGWELLSAA